MNLHLSDLAWRNLTALRFHYWTQPLPTPIAYYANLLPPWFQTASAVVMFAIELVATPGADAANEPWLAFAPRQEVTITRLGEYTKVVLTKSGAEMPAMPQPAWA